MRRAPRLVSAPPGQGQCWRDCSRRSTTIQWLWHKRVLLGRGHLFVCTAAPVIVRVPAGVRSAAQPGRQSVCLGCQAGKSDGKRRHPGAQDKSKDCGGLFFWAGSLDDERSNLINVWWRSRSLPSRVLSLSRGKCGASAVATRSTLKMSTEKCPIGQQKPSFVLDDINP